MTALAERSSPPQLAWLKRRLESLPAVGTCGVTSVPGPSVATASGAADGREAYPAQRKAILDGVESWQRKGVRWLFGALHFGAVTGVGAMGTHRGMHEVLIGPAARMRVRCRSRRRSPSRSW